MGKQQEEEEKKDRAALLLQERKKIIYNLVLVVTASFVVLIGVLTMAWFAMNRDASTGGMGIKSQAMPYTIQTRDSSGYYKDKWDSLGSQAMEWKISSDYNFDNHEDAIDTVNGETEPGLEPGDHGVLEFRVNPNTSDTITVDCIFDIKAYLETAGTDGNGDPTTTITEITDTALVGYVKAHIMLFADYDTTTGKYRGLIGTDAQLRRVLANQMYVKDGTTYTRIYWVWPMYLTNLTSNVDSNVIYDPSERSDVIAYIASNKDGFFKDCSDSVSQVTTDLTSLSTTYSNALYNHYSLRYDNADLDIGNNISYIMLSMQVDQ